MKKIVIFVLGIFLLSVVPANYPVFPRPFFDDVFHPNEPFVFNLTFTDDAGLHLFTNQSTLLTDPSGIAYTSLDISSLPSIPTRFEYYRNGTLILNETFDDGIYKNLYAQGLNLSGILSILGNSSFDGTLIPLTSLSHDIGSGALRWRNIYATNLSIDYIDVTNNINVLGDIMGPFGNFTELFAGGVNVSNMSNLFLNLSGTNANQNINLGIYNLSTPSINRLPFVFKTGEGGSDRFTIGVGGDITMAGNFDNDGRIITSGDLIVRKSRALPYLITETNDEGLTIYDNSASNNIMINLTIAGNYIGIGNITANLINGTFNWTISPGFSSSLSSFDGSNLTHDFNFFNDTVNASIDLRTKSTDYNATTITTVAGTLDAGNLASIIFPEDDDTYNVSEASGANPMIIVINFSNVHSFDNIVGRIYYDGGLGHEIQLEIQRSDTGVWENYLDLTDTTDFVNIYVPVFDPELHVFGSGAVSIRFNHVQSGIPTHNFFIDYLTIVEGWTTLTVADHDSLGGRDNIDNHPWALSKNGSRALTGDWQIGEHNITNASWIQTINLNVTGTSYLGTFEITDDLIVNNINISGTKDRIGIGTLTPLNPLDIVGIGNITGSLYVSGIELNATIDSRATIFNTTMGTYVLSKNTTMGIYVIDKNNTMGSYVISKNNSLAIWVLGKSYYNLSNFDINEYSLNSTMSNYVQAKNNSLASWVLGKSYYNLSDFNIANYPLNSTLENYAKWSEVGNGTLALNSSLEDYTRWSEIINGTVLSEESDPHWTGNKSLYVPYTNVSNSNVNQSDWWGSYSSTNSTVFESVGGVLNIIISWFEGKFRTLDNYTFEGDVDLNDHNLIDVNDIGQATDEIDDIYIGTNQKIYLGDGQESSMYYNGTCLIIAG